MRPYKPSPHVITAAAMQASSWRLVLTLLILLAAGLYVAAVTAMAGFTLPHLNLGPSVLSSKSFLGWGFKHKAGLQGKTPTEGDLPEAVIESEEGQEVKDTARSGGNQEMQETYSEEHLYSMVRAYLQGKITSLQHRDRATRTSIPHIIHQAWKSYLVPNATVPWIRSWAHHHPNWKYLFWTPENVKAFLKKYYPNLLDVYVNLPFDVQRADMMRYIVLYHYGGLYADLDMECLKPMDVWADSFSCVFPQEPHAHNLLYSYAKKNVLNSFLLCRPKHPFYKELISVLPNISHSSRINSFNDIISTTGPFFVQEHLQQFLDSEKSQRTGNDVTVVSPDYFNPSFDDRNIGYFKYVCSNETVSKNKDVELVHRVCQKLLERQFSNEPFDVSFSNHFWYHTWHSEDSWRNRSTIPISSIVPNVQIFR